MNKAEYQLIDARFRNIFNSLAAQLSKEGRENVEHFIEVAEVEMACESFILSVAEERIQLPGDAKKELLDLAIALHLDKQSVFRADFWQMAGPMLSGTD